jgi:hypothetical protein
LLLADFKLILGKLDKRASGSKKTTKQAATCSSGCTALDRYCFTLGAVNGGRPTQTSIIDKRIAAKVEVRWSKLRHGT